MKWPEPDENLRAGFAAITELAEGTGECSGTAAIWRAATGGSAPDEGRRLVAHAAGCPSCAAVWQLAGATIVEGDLLGVHLGPTGSNARSRPRAAWWLAAAAALVVLSALTLLQIGRKTESPWLGIAVPKALYSGSGSGPGEVIWRDPRASSEFEEAMRLYQGDDFAGAERRLAAFLEAHPKDATASFYRGVCLLLLGRPAEAQAPLESAIVGSEDSLRGEALWYRALSAVRQEHRGEALERLRAIAGSASPHREEARRLLERLGEAAPGEGP